MRYSRLTFPLAVLFSAALVVADANAQFGGIFGGSKSGRGGGNRGGDAQNNNQQGSNERRVAAPDPTSYEQIEYRISYLQDDLKLTGEQTGPWQAFAAKARAYAGDLARERAAAMRSATGSTAQGAALQHIGMALDAARNRLTALEDAEAAARTLYQTLTPEQKTMADLRIPTIIAPRPNAQAGSVSGANLPDLGSGSRPTR